MKIRDLISEFRIYTTNEESKVLESLDKPCALDSFSMREQTILHNLIRKSLVSRIRINGFDFVVKND